jgi:hypothetical protein
MSSVKQKACQMPDLKSRIIRRYIRKEGIPKPEMSSGCQIRIHTPVKDTDTWAQRELLLILIFRSVEACLKFWKRISTS